LTGHFGLDAPGFRRELTGKGAVEENGWSFVALDGFCGRLLAGGIRLHVDKRYMLIVQSSVCTRFEYAVRFASS
jgi:hypothetical protein